MVLSDFELLRYKTMESQLADGHGCVCFKGGFGSVSGWGVQVEKVLCGILWRGDGRGGVFYHFFHFCVD